MVLSPLFASKMVTLILISVSSSQRCSWPKRKSEGHSWVERLLSGWPRFLTSPGKYRNKYSDLAAFEERTTSNVTVYPYGDKILALKEDGRPHILNPDTLETIGIYDFEGQLDSKTFTAHPKWDPITKDFLCFGYEAKGLGTLDNCYMSINADGIMTEKVWFKAPWCGFQHEFSFTKNYVGTSYLSYADY
jgi:carotenoid cleavage dioxygenase-like enzyme